jgi:hypothetical protein
MNRLARLAASLMRPESMIPLAIAGVGLGLTYLMGVSKQLGDAVGAYQTQLAEVTARLDEACEKLAANERDLPPADPHSGVRVDYEALAES